MDWQSIAAWLWAVAPSVVAFVASALYTNVLWKRLERYKQELAAQHEKEVEQLRADLRRAAFEHETRFQKAHEKRAEVVAELCKRLWSNQVAFASLAAQLEFGGEPTKEEKERVAVDSFNPLSTYFHENRIYLEESLCVSIEQFMDKLREVERLWRREKRAMGQATQRTEEQDWWDKADKIATNDLPPLLRLIEARFRQLLGIKDR